MVQDPHETAQSVMSYAVGGGTTLVAVLVDISHVAQAVAIILGCVVVAVRLVHDVVRLVRYLKGS